MSVTRLLSILLVSWVSGAALQPAPAQKRSLKAEQVAIKTLGPLQPAQEPSLAGALQDLGRLEYAFSPVAGEEGVFSAPNRGQELRSRVSVKGLEVFPRSVTANGEGAPWRLKLGTKSFGRVDDPEDARALSGIPTVKFHERRAELDHGLLVEWFENTEKGIEHGWTIANRPQGTQALWIGLDLSGDLALRIEEGACSAVLMDAQGEARLGYRDLLAFDARGRALAARLEASPEGVGIRIEDEQAVYPLLVDPVLGPVWQYESNQAGANFGNSVSSAGDVNGDGYSDVIVGAPLYDNGQSNEGRAYLFHGSASGLSTTPAWIGEINQGGARFGWSVALAGDVNGDGYSDVIVGALLFSNDQSEEGGAFLYFGSTTGLSAAPAWAGEGDQAGGSYGNSVATAGDVNGDGYSDVIVGALKEGAGSHPDGQGRAYLYSGSASGLSTTATWFVEDNQSGTPGQSVSTAGDVNGDGFDDVIVGASGFSNGQTGEGRASVYLGSAAGLSTSASWTAEGNQSGAGFGSSVSTAGDVNRDGYGDVIIGAPYFDFGSSVDNGKIWVYAGSAAGLSAAALMSTQSAGDRSYFGNSVAMAGDVNGDGYGDVIVGAPGYTTFIAAPNAGTARVYLGSASGSATLYAWSRSGDQSGESFGASIALAGDVNGDGYSDLIVGAYGYDGSSVDEGRALVYLGAVETSTTETWRNVVGPGAYGWSVASAGDVDGDGYSDTLVGDPLDDGNEGKAFVYMGSAAGPSSSASWSVEETNNGVVLGASVSSAGDVNGDGYSDVIVGAPSYLEDAYGAVLALEPVAGEARVYLGSDLGLGTSPAWIATGDQPYEAFATSVATAGDVNGDGYSDVLVGAPLFDNGQADAGRALVYLGSARGLASIPIWTVEGQQAGARLGWSIACAGDVNGDGYSDVIVGAPGYSNGDPSEGRAALYLGSATGLPTSPAWVAEGNNRSAQFGKSVASAGDTNGDGYSDLIVGAPLFDADLTYPSTGAAYVYHGSPAGPGASPIWEAIGAPLPLGGFLGVSVSSAGDVNGDGYSEVVVCGIPYRLVYGSAQGPSGGVETLSFRWSTATAGDVNGDGYADVIYGNYADTVAALVSGISGGAYIRCPQQLRRDGSKPIALLGRTGASGLFRVKTQFTYGDLSGFSWASPQPGAFIEVETKPQGTPFDGTGILRSPLQAFGSSGGTLTFDEMESPGIFPPKLGWTGERVYKWRARIVTNNPVFPRTRWFSVPGNNITEAKFRKPEQVP